MAMGQKSPDDLWAKILQLLRFAARVLAAVLIIAAVGMLSFLLFFAMYRFTAYLWIHFLCDPW